MRHAFRIARTSSRDSRHGNSGRAAEKHLRHQAVCGVGRIGPILAALHCFPQCVDLGLANLRQLRRLSRKCLHLNMRARKLCLICLGLKPRRRAISWAGCLSRPVAGVCCDPKYGLILISNPPLESPLQFKYRSRLKKTLILGLLCPFVLAHCNFSSASSATTIQTLGRCCWKTPAFKRVTHITFFFNRDYVRARLRFRSLDTISGPTAIQLYQ
jgi:hypothetical protein